MEKNGSSLRRARKSIVAIRARPCGSSRVCWPGKNSKVDWWEVRACPNAQWTEGSRRFVKWVQALLPKVLTERRRCAFTAGGLVGVNTPHLLRTPKGKTHPLFPPSFRKGRPRVKNQCPSATKTRKSSIYSSTDRTRH